MFIRILLMVLLVLVEAKFEWKFQIKRGGQEPWRPFQNNQLLERIHQRKQQYGQITIVQKMKNVKLRNFLSKITNKNGAPNKQQKWQHIEWTDCGDFIKTNFIFIKILLTFMRCFRVFFTHRSLSTFRVYLWNTELWARSFGNHLNWGYSDIRFKSKPKGVRLFWQPVGKFSNFANKLHMQENDRQKCFSPEKW